ncbi:MAG: GUN4 domain-containing protein [Cyanobacteria bacterium J06623_7]
MNFTNKINQLTVVSAVSSILISGLLATIAPPQANALQNQQTIDNTAIAQSLRPEEVNLRAKQIIVRIDGASFGSGSIIEHNGDRYKVLTNWHVMQNQGGYTVQTIDGRKHEVIPASIQQLEDLDLAIFEFASNQNYQTAELGNSGNANEGQTVYFAGYPGELRREDNRYYRFFTANLVGILPRATENGYSLIYNGEAFPGMSGGPVFNRQGLMIGVHGEANVAFTGGTSNYAIPIARYQQAIAQAAAPPANPTPEPEAVEPQAAEPEVVETETVEPEVPEVIVEEPTPAPKEPVATPVKPESIPEEPAQAAEIKEPEATESLDAENISSVPTFAPAKSPESTPEQESKTPTDTSAESEPVVESAPEPEVGKEPKATGPEVAAQPKNKPAPPTESVEIELEEVDVPTVTRKIALVSPQTGINYTKLRNLLKGEKWSEADLLTYRLVGQIVESAKLNNKNTFIELKTIAEYACPDIRTVDYLWKKYSNDQFGFSQQQSVWQNVNQKGDFSTETWRRFATEVGWKKGEVNSGSGYLLYEQLDFEPEKAPAGHLPWWFALADEEQKVIKSLFARCNLNPTLAELEAEAKQNSNDTAQNPGNNENRRRDTNNAEAEANVDKKPQQSEQ